jgi:hypothetical protein
VRLERAVGEQPVIADGDPDRRQQVHDGEDHEVARAEKVVPQQHRRRYHPQEGDDDCGDVGVALEAGHLTIVNSWLGTSLLLREHTRIPHPQPRGTT